MGSQANVVETNGETELFVPPFFYCSFLMQGARVMLGPPNTSRKPAEVARVQPAKVVAGGLKKNKKN